MPVCLWTSVSLPPSLTLSGCLFLIANSPLRSLNKGKLRDLFCQERKSETAQYFAALFFCLLPRCRCPFVLMPGGSCEPAGFLEEVGVFGFEGLLLSGERGPYGRCRCWQHVCGRRSPSTSQVCRSRAVVAHTPTLCNRSAKTRQRFMRERSFR